MHGSRHVRTTHDETVREKKIHGQLVTAVILFFLQSDQNRAPTPQRREATVRLAYVFFNGLSERQSHVVQVNSTVRS